MFDKQLNNVLRMKRKKKVSSCWNRMGYSRIRDFHVISQALFLVMLLHSTQNWRCNLCGCFTPLWAFIHVLLVVVRGLSADYLLRSVLSLMSTVWDFTWTIPLKACLGFWFMRLIWFQPDLSITFFLWSLIGFHEDGSIELTRTWRYSERLLFDLP